MTMSDCTEPNRDKCPRLCLDFCNKAETEKANSRCSDSAGSIPPDVQASLDEVSDRHSAAALAWAKEDSRLSKLPLLDLIREVLLSDEGDSLLVVELMNRACPKWEEQIIDEG